MKLTKENVCLRNTEKARKVLNKFGYTPYTSETLSYPHFIIHGADYMGDDVTYSSTILIKPKHLKAILNGKDVQLVDGKVVVIEPEKPAELLTSEYGAELEIITGL